jgi:hypothetical protein
VHQSAQHVAVLGVLVREPGQVLPDVGAAMLPGDPSGQLDPGVRQAEVVVEVDPDQSLRVHGQPVPDVQ